MEPLKEHHSEPRRGEAISGDKIASVASLPRNDARAEIKRYFSGGKFRGQLLFGEKLAGWTSWRIGGPCLLLAQPASLTDLETALKYFCGQNIPWRVLGGGTNILVADEGLKAAIISLEALAEKFELPSRKSSTGQVKVRVPAGIQLPALLSRLAGQGLSGLEFAAGVGASLAGSILNNFGAFDKTLGDLWTEIKGLSEDGRLIIIRRDQVKVGDHRSSLPGQKMILLEATLRLDRTDPALVRKNITTCLKERRLKQPLDRPSAGCVFRNPPKGQPAGWLLEQAGLKGARQGGAEVSTKHANFIVSHKGATARDVLLLMKKMVKEVESRFSVRLGPEIELWSDSLTWEQVFDR